MLFRSTETDYIVTGTDTHNCYDTAKVTLIVHPLPNVSIFPSNPSICERDNIVLTASGANSYIWNPSNTLSSSTGNEVTASPTATTLYTVTGTESIFNCENTSTTNVTVNLYPIINLGEDIYFCSQLQITLDAGSGNYSYRWQDGINISQYYVVPKPETYWVKVTNLGCTSTDTIKVLECVDVDFPNAFSPNGDGWNDVFKPKGSYLENFKLIIYNRWGKTIYESEDIIKGWDGKINGSDAAAGVYYWTAEYKRAGFVDDKDNKKIKGSVTLLRD